MLRLLQVGLLEEAQMIDSFNINEFGDDIRNMALSNVPGLLDDEAEEDSKNAQDSTVRSREAYVRHVLRQHRNQTDMGSIKNGKHEGAAEMRRMLIKDFLGKIVSEKKCRHCDGISPVYRKDRYVKIFERDLSTKERAAMAQAGRKHTDAVRLAQRSSKDEAIADIDVSPDGSEEEQESEGEGEELDENGDVVMGEAPVKLKLSQIKERRARYLTTLEVMERLKLLFEKEQDMLTLLYNAKPRPKKSPPMTAEMFFIQTLLVPPNRYRPEVSKLPGCEWVPITVY